METLSWLVISASAWPLNSIRRLAGTRLRSRRTALGATESEVAVAISVVVPTLNLFDEDHKRVSAEHVFLSCQKPAMAPVELFKRFREGNERKWRHDAAGFYFSVGKPPKYGMNGAHSRLLLLRAEVIIRDEIA